MVYSIFFILPDLDLRQLRATRMEAYELFKTSMTILTVIAS